MKEKALAAGSNRNYGIDALRLFSMFLVLILHILIHGGGRLGLNGAKHAVACFLIVTAYCAVNCFAVISGYVSYSEHEKEDHYFKFVPLWLQVTFYSFGITLLAFIISPEKVGVVRLIKSVMPVVTTHYWYFTAYTALFFVMPWLNRFVRRCSEKEMHMFVLLLFLLFSCFASVSRMFEMIFGLEGGFSFLWLAILYLIGAWMKKCSIPERVKASHAAVWLIASILVTWGIIMIFKTDRFLTYIFPTILIMAVAYVILFSKIQFGPRWKKCISFFAPAAFGVYLIHVQDLVWTRIFYRSFTWISAYPAWMILVLTLGLALIMAVVFLLIEKLRILIFRVCHINEFAQNLCKRIWNFFCMKLQPKQ